MKISPIHFNISRSNLGSGNAYRNSMNMNGMNNKFNSSLDNNDVFVRLATASTKDARIEQELIEMGLI